MVVLCTKDGYENNTGKQYCVKGKTYEGVRGESGLFTYEDELNIRRQAKLDGENFVKVTDNKYVIIDGDEVIVVSASSYKNAIERMDFDGNFEAFLGENGFRVYKVTGEILSDKRYIPYDED